ncbi:MAG: putative Ig domain-containing protein [Sumerlaeia bacterium]
MSAKPRMSSLFSPEAPPRPTRTAGDSPALLRSLALLLALAASAANAATCELVPGATKANDPDLTRGTVFSVNETLLLEDFSMDLVPLFDLTAVVTFNVLQAPSANGPWSVLYQNSSTIDLGRAFYNSGPVDVVVEPGQYYAATVSWDASEQVRYFYTSGAAPFGFGTVNGTLQGGFQSATSNPLAGGGTTTTYGAELCFGPAEVNSAPIIDAIPDQFIDCDQLLTYAVQAVDAETAQLAFSLDSAPSGAYIDAATGWIDWLPSVPAQCESVYTFEVRATDDGVPPLSAVETFYVYTGPVPAPNEPPVIADLPDQSAECGGTYLRSIPATDPNGDNLTFSLDSAPYNAVIDPNSGFLNWTPVSPNQCESVYQFVVRATDDGAGNLFDLETFYVSVDPFVPGGNLSPDLDPVPDQFSECEEVFTYQLTAADPNPGDSLYFSLDAGPYNAYLDPYSGWLSWQRANTSECETSYYFQVSVWDNGSPANLSDTETFYVHVGPPEPNNPPAFDPMPGYHAVLCEQSFQTPIFASDPNPLDDLTYSLDSGPGGAFVSPGTGWVYWTPSAPDQCESTYEFIVRVTDNGIPNLFDLETFYVEVGAPETNYAPQIDPIPYQYAACGNYWSYPVTATDQNSGDALYYSLDSAPSGAWIDPYTGWLDWVPYSPQYCESVYQFEVRVTDNGVPPLFDVETFYVDVSPEINYPPYIFPINDQYLACGDSFAYSVGTHDSNPGDMLSFSLDAAPAGATIDPALGELSWTPSSPDQCETSYLFIVRATDDGVPPLADTESFYVHVGPPTSVDVCETVPGATKANDPDLARGATFTVDSNAMLTDFSMDLVPLFDLEANVTFFVLSGPSENGPWTQEFASPQFIDSGRALYNSGPVDLDLTPGVHYVAGVSWSAAEQVRYFYTTNIAPIAFTEVPGTLAGGFQSPSEDPLLGGSTTTTYGMELCFTIGGAAPNSPPSIDYPVGNFYVDCEQGFGVVVQATDPDPGDVLTFSLDSAPSGTSLDSVSGWLQWYPVSPSQCETTLQFVLRVTDDGVPPLSDVETVYVEVGPLNYPPSLDPIPDQLIDCETTFNFVATATDPNPGDLLTFALDSGPYNASIDPFSGLISWTPDVPTQCESIFNFTVQVADNGSPQRYDYEYFTVEVRPETTPSEPICEIVPGATKANDPDLARGTIFSVGETATLTDFSMDLVPLFDLEANVEFFVLSGPSPNGPWSVEFQQTSFIDSGRVFYPSGDVNLSLSPGFFYVAGVAWDATEQVRFFYTTNSAPATFVEMNGVLESGFQSASSDPLLGGSTTTTYGMELCFSTGSAPANNPPLITGPTGTFSAGCGEFFSIYVNASDPDPGDSLTFSLDSAPSGAFVDPVSGYIQWTPANPAQCETTYEFAFRVTDDGVPPLSATETFYVEVGRPNLPPSLDPIADQAIDCDETLQLSAFATDPDPEDTLTYSFLAAPLGATIGASNGQIQWTPIAPFQCESSYTFVVHVTDDGSPPMGTVEGFDVTVGGTPDEPGVQVCETIPGALKANSENLVRGATFTVNQDYILDEFSMDLVPLGGIPADVTFYVLSGPSDAGPWSIEFQQPYNIDSGRLFYNSGTVSLPLQPGTFYAAGAGWTTGNNVRYFYTSNAAPFAFPTVNGTVAGGFQSSTSDPLGGVSSTTTYGVELCLSEPGGPGGPAEEDWNVLFADAFNTNTSAQYTEVVDSTSYPANYDTAYGFDYGSIINENAAGYPFVGEAPSSQGSDLPTHGLVTFANPTFGGLANRMALAIYPNLTPILGDHRFTVDLLPLIGFNGPTEHFGLGINHSGAAFPNVYQGYYGDFTPITDGYFGFINTDYGAAIRDIVFYEGDPFMMDPGLDPALGDFAWGDPNLTVLSDGLALPPDPYATEPRWFLDYIFTNPPYRTGSGADGPHGAWMTLRMTFLAGKVTWEVKPEGAPQFYTLATYDDPDDTYIGGLPQISHLDTFYSQNGYGRMIWDNFTIEILGEVTPPAPEVCETVPGATKANDENLARGAMFTVNEAKTLSDFRMDLVPLFDLTANVTFFVLSGPTSAGPWTEVVAETKTIDQGRLFYGPDAAPNVALLPGQYYVAGARWPVGEQVRYFYTASSAPAPFPVVNGTLEGGFQSAGDNPLAGTGTTTTYGMELCFE